MEDTAMYKTEFIEKVRACAMRNGLKHGLSVFLSMNVRAYFAERNGGKRSFLKIFHE